MSKPGNICPTVTSITCTMEHGRFPADENPCYLAQKAEVGMRLPERISTKAGLLRFLNQLVMSGMIRIEERAAKFLWPYKAEVVFAIANPVPLPMLATSAVSLKAYGDNLPQSSSPFARPSPEGWVNKKVRRMRRPDIILVKDPSQRWPGRAAEYFDGKPHSDNLKMLIEVKFPGDTLSRGQRDDYVLIATEARFGVMRVEDNRTEKQKEYDRQYNLSTRPSAERYLLPPLLEGKHDENKLSPIPVAPPEGVPGTIPQPLHKNLPLLSSSPWNYLPSAEDWLRFGDEVSSLVTEGWEFVRAETREKFHQFGAWVTEKGNWVCKEIIDPVTRQASFVISWVSDKTGEVITWTLTELQALWKTVLSGMDISLDYLKQIDWLQILHDIGDGTVQLIIKAGEILNAIILPVVIVAALVILVAAIIFSGGGAAILTALGAVSGGTVIVAH